MLAFLLLAGCGEGSDRASANAPAAGDATTADTTLIDALGRRVTLTLPARRVVSLAPNLTEIVFAASAGRHLAAVTTADDFPPAVDTLAKVQAYPQIDFESVAAHQPDLALATDQVNAPRDAETLEALGAPAYFFSFASLDDVFAAIETTGRLMGTLRRSTQAADSLRRIVERVERHTAALSDDERPLVLFLIGDNALYPFAENSYMHDLIRRAGGRSATADLATAAPLSEEFVLETRPDVIVGTFGPDYAPQQLAELHPSWRGVVPALENGRVYSVSNAFLRPGPRLAGGVQRLARLLHLTLFDDVEDAAAPADSTTAHTPAR